MSRLRIDSGELVLDHRPLRRRQVARLLKLMAAIELASSGTVIISGQNVAKLKPAAVPFLRRRFGIVFQDHKLLYDRSVFQNVLLPLQIAGFDGRDAARRARAALDKVGLLAKEKAMPITLSGGEQQRVCIARAVVHRPAVLLVDEPTGNLDEAYARDIVELFALLPPGGRHGGDRHPRPVSWRSSSPPASSNSGRDASPREELAARSRAEPCATPRTTGGEPDGVAAERPGHRRRAEPAGRAVSGAHRSCSRSRASCPATRRSASSWRLDADSSDAAAIEQKLRADPEVGQLSFHPTGAGTGSI